MGITKLLPELSEFTSTDVDLSVVLKAKRVVVDASVWLHQFLFYFATATNHEEVIVARVVRRARRLIELGAFVIVVLDSIDTVMPAKAITIEERRIRRAEVMLAQLEARTRLNKPQSRNHQMVHLVKGGHADYVLTVDSDVASHGVPIVSHTDWSTLRGTVVHVQTGEAAIRKVALLMPYTSMGQKFCTRISGGWVYDITTKKCCTLDGSEPSEAIVGVLPRETQMIARSAKSSPATWDRHQLFRAGDACPQALTYDMVPNSYLSDTRIASSAVTTNELKAWLRVGDFHSVTTEG
ncbi:hypothetical protein NFJ02_02g71870 [Pycnococcus provasolii]